MSKPILSRKIARGFYPENVALGENLLANLTYGLCLLRNSLPFERNRFSRTTQQILQAGEALCQLSDEKLTEQVQSLRAGMRRADLDLDFCIKAFALIRELSWRILGMRHFEVQVTSGLILLSGMVAEMQTGEGKTLTALLPAGAAALAGIPVHIITVNDYLAERDAEWMRPVYESLGLTVGVIVQGMSLEKRQEAYRCDITYCSNKEVAFDYLKDRLQMGEKPGQIQLQVKGLAEIGGKLDRICMRGLCFAIIDEADSVLIDEARTPLIISGQGNNFYEAKIYEESLGYARQLEEDQHFIIDEMHKNVELTRLGQEELQKRVANVSGFWAGKQRREEIVQLALSALHLFKLDEEYLIKDGKIQIIDEYTGRVMADRSWEKGLHQVIEAKEGCDITPQRETLARISYQRFFRRYKFIAGMTGTAKEVARELWSVYKLRVVAVPPNKPNRRAALPSRFFSRSNEKWSVVVSKVKQLHENGQPVLIGTRSVSASEHLSGLLLENGLEHRVLNARQDKEEAQIIEEAGQAGKITVATNMAGRGTDILLGEGVREVGGLHVIATERHTARRIDRQLFGRCGRQGDPGSYEMFACAEDEVIEQFCPFLLRKIALPLLMGRSFFEPLLNMIATFSQMRVERKHFLTRKDLLDLDESLDSLLAFTGKGE